MKTRLPYLAIIAAILSNIAVFVTIVLTIASNRYVFAEQATTLLEKGVYYQETSGDIDAAIQTYKKVVEDAQANRPAVAEALYRLGVCQLKKKQQAEAVESFQTLLSHYGDQQPFATKAKEQIDDLTNSERKRAIQAVFENPEPIVKMANAIFEGIRTADYDRWLNGGEGWGSFPITKYYQTYQWYDMLVPWICKTFKADPIQTVMLGKVIKNEDGLPAIPYKLTLASGKVMEGILPFNAKEDGQWYARWGIDWHLKKMQLTEPKKTTAAAAPPAKVQTRTIGKSVAAFAEGDLSTPESAAASYCRASGRMDSKALADVFASPVSPDVFEKDFEGMKKKMDPQELETWNKSQLTATIVQVQTYRDKLAMVVVRLNFPPGFGRHPFSGRQFGLIDGKWKNLGEDRYPTALAAQASFEKHKDKAWEGYLQTAE